MICYLNSTRYENRWLTVVVGWKKTSFCAFPSFSVVWHKDSISVCLHRLVMSVEFLCRRSWGFLISPLCTSLNRTCGSKGPRTRQPTNFPASCAGLKSSQSPQWVWGACALGRPPNQIRIRSLAQRQSIWFVHFSCIDSRVDVRRASPQTNGRARSLSARGPALIHRALLKARFHWK